LWWYDGFDARELAGRLSRPAKLHERIHLSCTAEPFAAGEAARKAIDKGDEDRMQRKIDAEAKRLREYLLKGGFPMLDDLHGTEDWENFMNGMRQDDRRRLRLSRLRRLFALDGTEEKRRPAPCIRGDTRRHCRAAA
jgi:hypothetical protein